MSNLDFIKLENADLKTQIAYYKQQNEKLTKELIEKNEQVKLHKEKVDDLIQYIYTVRSKIRDVMLDNKI